MLCFREDLIDLGFEPKDFKSANIIYCGALENDTSRDAKVCVPLRSEFEKEGMWINRQFRVQKFDRAVEAPKNSYCDCEFLVAVLREVSGASFETPSIKRVRKVMCEKIPALRGCENVGKLGVLIDGSAFAHIAFPETDAMHFKKDSREA